MSQKKPTTNQQLEEMRAMIADLEPGKVISVDRELQERNASLMLMLYGATAKYGIGLGDRGEKGILITAQVPVLQVPQNQTLQWEVSPDGRSIMLYIVANEVEDTAEEPSTPPPSELEPKATIENLIADEFEDEIKIGLDDEEDGIFLGESEDPDGV